jgi:hypothetical protein
MNQKRIDEMTVAELATMASEFDNEFIADSFGAMSDAQQMRWDRAKRKRGRPRNGKGCKVISVSIEKGLLTKADKVAKSHKISRAKLISAGLMAILKGLQPRR